MEPDALNRLRRVAARQTLTLTDSGRESGKPYEYKPAQFFLLTYALTWIPWIAAAYYSYQRGMVAYSYTFFSLGGFGPFVSAFVFTWRSKSQGVKHDFLDRLVDPRRFSLPYLPITLLLPPCVSYVSVLISECFGRPASQLTLVPPVLAWIPFMFVGPALEELGWRGYLSILATSTCFIRAKIS